MASPSIFRSLFTRKSVATITRKPRAYRPWLETLEDRLAPAIFTVTTNADAGADSLRAAIVAANATAAADTITFAAALNNQTITLSGTPFNITKPLTITGPGAALLKIDANNASRIFNVDDNAATSIAVAIFGLTLTKGSAAGGGAIYSTETLMVTNSTLSGNTATANGGVIFNNFGTLTVTNSTLSGNTATNDGGAIFNSDGTVTVTNSTLSGNTSIYKGGGIDNDNDGRLTVTNSTLSGNTARFGDGGIKNSGTLTVANSTLAGNTAIVRAGGIDNDNDGRLTVTNSTLSGNAAPNGTGGGGILNHTFHTVTVTNSTLSRNTARFGGGGIKNSGTLTVTNSTLVANRVNSDGVDTETGGGIFTQTGGSSTLFNTIVAGNLSGAGAGTPDDLSGSSNVQGASANNLIGDPATAGGLVNGNSGNIVGSGGALLPLASILDPVLRNNGGPTQTHALISGSVAIDAGNNANALGGGSALTTDQRGPGFARIINPTVDIGAYEMPRALFTDNFTCANSVALGAPWLNRAGALGIVGNQAQGTGVSTVHLSTLNGATAKDVDLYAAVNLQNGQAAGLIARYTGPADTKYYLGALQKDSLGNVVAKIVRQSGVAVTELAVIGGVSTSTGTLRFRVVGSVLQLFLNGTLLTSVRDTLWTTGGFGVRTLGTTKIDDFQAWPLSTGLDHFDAFTHPTDTALIRGDQFARLDDFRVVAVTARLPFTDAFTQADASVSDQWTRRAGIFLVSGNLAVGSPAAPAVNLATLVGVKAANVEVQADVMLVTTGHEIGLVACYVGTADMYYYMARVLRTAAGFNLSIVKNLAGVVTTLGETVNVPGALTRRIKFRIAGTSLKLFVNDVEKISTTDSSLNIMGSVGMRSIGSGTIDNISATAFNFLPFNDNFEANTLNANWGILASGYNTTVAANKIVGTAALNLATLGRFSVADVDVQAVIDVPNTGGRFASLVARYSGTGDLNMYLATVSFNGTQLVASIQKRVNGVTTTLASVNLGGGGAGTLRFSVIGGQLKLFFNNVERLSVFDFTFKNGSVGLRSSLTSTFDDFKAS